MGWWVSWVVCTGDISCEYLAWRGRQECVHSPKGCIGGCILAPPFLPAIDNSLVVAINCKWHAGVVDGKQGADEELKSNALCPPDVPSVAFPVVMELPGMPPIANDNHQAMTGAGIRKSMEVECERVKRDWDGGLRVQCL